MSNQRILQRVASDFLQRATSATSNERFCNEKLLQQVTSDFCNERLLQQVASDFFQQSTSTMSNERISQRVTSDFF